MGGRLVLGVAGAVACALALPAPALGQTVFAPDSYLNQPLQANAPLDPNSATMVAELARQVGVSNLRPNEWNASVEHHNFAAHVYVVSPGQGTVNVTSPDDDLLEEQFTGVPIPPDAVPSPGSDGELVIYQPSLDPSQDKMWEFWQAKRVDQGQWSATFGGRMDSVSTNPGHFIPYPNGRVFGATATSIPHLAGLQRLSELDVALKGTNPTGILPHAVSFAMKQPAPCYRWPALRQDSPLTTANSSLAAPPEGARLRLPASLNIDAIPDMTAYGRMLARTIQRYGMVLRDRSGLLVFHAEAPRPLPDPLNPDDPNDPYNRLGGYFGRTGGGSWDRYVLKNFPWDKLQVLDVPANKSRCEHWMGG
jgi:hypothetical protein